MFGRKRRATVGTYVEAPLAPLDRCERVVEEGALIYISSARMAVKNQIIVAAIGRQQDYAPQDLRAAVSRELENLAVDNDETADRLESAAGSPVEHESDMDDELVLQKREDQRRRPLVLRSIAAHLRELAVSAPEVEALVDQARAQAVDEMFRAINARLAHNSVEADADYAAQRQQRLRDFVAFDLLGEEPAAEQTPPPAAKRNRRAKD
jgi:hypothetical protein